MVVAVAQPVEVTVPIIKTKIMRMIRELSYHSLFFVAMATDNRLWLLYSISTGKT
jgi:hypothetical protein